MIARHALQADFTINFRFARNIGKKRIAEKKAILFLRNSVKALILVIFNKILTENLSLWRYGTNELAIDFSSLKSYNYISLL